MYINTVNSTNTWLREHLHDFEGDCLWTTCQTAGRGQTGNSWESEPGKNLLFSSLLKQPALDVTQAFRLTMATSLAVYDVLAARMEAMEGLSIKWPNDIYVGDQKIGGILIETILQGKEIVYAIVGIGLNINQTTWLGDAPNPISLKQVTGKEWKILGIEQSLEEALAKRLLEVKEGVSLKMEYMQRLYRREGQWPFVERAVSIEPTHIVTQPTGGAFQASIWDVEETGKLVLALPTSTGRAEYKKYHFKEIQYIV